MKNDWNELINPLKERWKTLSDNEIHQANGLEELVSLISSRTGDPRPNILHEVIDLVRNVDNNHPLLLNYFNSTRATGSGEAENQL